MPRKHRDIRSALERKGFETNKQSHHLFFVYRCEDGRRTSARTKLSHENAGADVSNNLLSMMAKQVGLTRAEFLKLIDCPMSRTEYEHIARP